jgi:hypothetical protein
VQKSCTTYWTELVEIAEEARLLCCSVCCQI